MHIPFSDKNSGGGLLARLRAERQLVELLADDGGNVRVAVERNGARVCVAIEHDGLERVGEGASFVAAWADLVDAGAAANCP